jgi:hypothetical protein
MTRAEVFGINIVIETDEPGLIRSFFEFTTRELAFDYKTKTKRMMDY